MLINCERGWAAPPHSRVHAALLMFFYTLAAALIGHRYWTLTGTDKVDSMDAFYKNISIMGGFLLLWRGKMFDQCIVQCRRTIACVLSG
jgi:hypothetical protein